MVLAHVTAEGAGKFSEGEYHGVVLPAGAGSIAVVARKGQEFDGDLEGRARRRPLSYSTSQPDCGPPRMAARSGSHSRIASSTR